MTPAGERDSYWAAVRERAAGELRDLDLPRRRHLAAVCALAGVVATLLGVAAADAWVRAAEPAPRAAETTSAAAPADPPPGAGEGWPRCAAGWECWETVRADRTVQCACPGGAP